MAATYSTSTPLRTPSLATSAMETLAESKNHTSTGNGPLVLGLAFRSARHKQSSAPSELNPTVERLWLRFSCGMQALLSL